MQSPPTYRPRYDERFGLSEDGKAALEHYRTVLEDWAKAYRALTQADEALAKARATDLWD